MSPQPPSPSAEQHLQQARLATQTGAEWPLFSPQEMALHTAQDRTVAVIGAGTMGRGIAQAALSAGFTVLVHDISDIAIQSCVAAIEQSLQRRGLSAAELAACLRRLHTSTNIQALQTADLVIEAVYENLALKQALMGQLHTVCAPHALLISNTSTLDIDALGQASQRPAQMLGMHFLTPAHVTPLVEVIPGAATSAASLWRAKHFAESLAKLPVLSRNAWGFIGNRMYEGFLEQVDILQLEGTPAHRIDAALEEFGFALGPCRTLDMSGTDLVSQVIAERDKIVPQDTAYRRVTRLLAELGRFGMKSGRGHYLYHGRQAMIDPELSTLLQQEAQKLGIAPNPSTSAANIVDRCLRPLVAEGYQLLQEGIACRASDIDLVWVLGYGFPASKGGPMYWAHLNPHLCSPRL